MAKLEIYLSQEQFGGLDEGLKQFYTLNKEGKYELEGIGSMDRALAVEKTRNDEAIKKAKADAIREALGDIDPEAAKKAFSELEQARRDKLSADERHAEDLEKFKADLAKERGEKEQVLDGFKRKELELTLLSKGVRKEYLDLAALKVGNQVEVAKGDNGLTLKVRDEIGDFDKLTEGLRGSYPALFESTSASGSGASGSQSTGGNAKTMPEAQFDALSPKEQAAFIQSGGQPV